MGQTKEDFDSIANGAVAIKRAADDFAEGLQELQATVTTDNPWGGDEPGTVFGMAYTALLGHALETFGSHQELLAAGAEKLTTWAEQSRQTEEENSDLVSRPDPSVVQI